MLAISNRAVLDSPRCAKASGFSGSMCSGSRSPISGNSAATASGPCPTGQSQVSLALASTHVGQPPHGPRQPHPHHPIKRIPRLDVSNNRRRKQIRIANPHITLVVCVLQRDGTGIGERGRCAAQRVAGKVDVDRVDPGVLSQVVCDDLDSLADSVCATLGENLERCGRRATYRTVCGQVGLPAWLLNPKVL